MYVRECIYTHTHGHRYIDREERSFCVHNFYFPNGKRGNLYTVHEGDEVGKRRDNKRSPVFNEEEHQQQQHKRQAVAFVAAAECIGKMGGDDDRRRGPVEVWQST